MTDGIALYYNNAAASGLLHEVVTLSGILQLLGLTLVVKTALVDVTAMGLDMRFLGIFDMIWSVKLVLVGGYRDIRLLRAKGYVLFTYDDATAAWSRHKVAVGKGFDGCNEAVDSHHGYAPDGQRHRHTMGDT